MGELDTVLLTNDIVSNIVSNIVSDKKCTLTTLAIQDRLYSRIDVLEIDLRLFNIPFHSKLSKATLFLHEYLYLAARKKGSVDSRRVRMLVRLILRRELPILKIKHLIQDFL